MMGLHVFEASPFTLRLWSNYLAASLILWSPMLFSNKRRWTYVVSILLDVWFIGNLAYYRSYGDVLNRWCLQNIGNMDGIWTSVLPFLHGEDLVLVCITFVWIVLSETIHFEYYLSLTKRIGIAVSAFLILCLPHTLIHRKAELPLSPFNTYYADLSMGRTWYICCFGAITHLANEGVNLILNRESKAQSVSVNEVAAFIGKPDTIPEQENLLFIIFESLEDWTIGLQVDGAEVTPNINRLIKNSQTGHYVMSAQVKEGKSSDAQLIAFNGLLPIKNGAASMRYANNAYPSFVKYSHAHTKRLFAAYSPYMWNQHMNALSYGFDTLYAKKVSDCVLADSVIAAITYSDSSFIFTMVSMASHSPFLEYADSSSLHISNIKYDETKIHYLQCVHYTDSALGPLIEAVLGDSTLAANTRIVIIGDHPVFKIDTFVPFILYDPFVAPVAVGRPLYQIDVYTTLVERMHIDTNWKGLGRNIADTCAYTSEQMHALESLSDRIIRTDYFSK